MNTSVTRWRVIVCLVLILSPGVFFGEGNGGTDDIFSFGAGARAIALGRTFVGLADDVSSLFWNAAGIYNIDQKTVSLFYSQLFEGTMYGFMGYVHPTADYGSFGLGIMSIYTGDITAYDASSYELGSFSSSRMKFILSYANQLPWLPLSFGVSAKMNIVSIDEYSGSSLNFDLSLQYDLVKRSFKDRAAGKGRDDLELVAGFVFRNILVKAGERLNLESDEENFQIVFGASMMKRLNKEVFGRVVVDLLLHEERPLTASLGLEVVLYDAFFIRTGYAIESGFSFGGGVHLHGWDIDYALAFRDLGATHNFSVSWRFGESRVGILQEREERIKKRIAKDVLKERAAQDSKYSGILKDKDDVIKRKDQEISDLEKRRREQIKQAEKRIQDLKQRGDERLARYRTRLEQTIKKNGQQIKRLQEEREAALKKMQEETRKQIAALRDSHSKRMDALETTYKAQIAGVSLTNRIARERLTRRFLQEKETLKRQEDLKAKEYVKGLELYNKALYTQALVHFRAVVRIDPRYAEAQTYINKIMAQGRDIASYSTRIRSFYRQGVKFYLGGQFQRAIAIWQEILKIDPYNKLAHKNIDMAKKRVEFLKKYSK